MADRSRGRAAMSRTVAFAYPGARLQARYGQLLPDASWERLFRIEDYGAFLQSARDSALRPWVLHLDPAGTPHQIERHLRAQYRQRVRMVAGWMPPDWRPAVRWVERLPDLPAAAHVLAGGAAADWVREDPPLASLIAARQNPPRRVAGLALLARGPAGGESLFAAWRARWGQTWPEMAAEERAGMEALAALLDPAQRAAGAAPARAPLRRLFRRQARAPAGAFAYLALLWQEMVRLRGALLRRRLALPLEEAA